MGLVMIDLYREMDSALLCRDQSQAVAKAVIMKESKALAV
jgi:hypothetical protein